MSRTPSSTSIESLLRQLIQVPSVSGNGEASEKIISVAYDLLQPTGAILSREDINGYHYLLASTKKPDKDTLWFVCHLDVVPAEDSMFELTSDDTNYYGRGVFDMKGMAAAVIAAFASLKKSNGSNVGLLFTTDEEIGGKNGVAALAEKHCQGAVAFVFDQSSDWILMEKMKGILWLEVTATGKAAHGARPWLGQSANQELVEYLTALKAWYDTAMPQHDPNNYYTTFNLGTLQGGQATNQVSDSAKATIDIRFVSEEDAAKVVKAVRDLAKEHRGISVKELMHESCVVSDTTETWYRQTAQSMQQLGIKAGQKGERYGHGSTDGRYFTPLGVPVITTRPPGGGQHGPEEWVSKQGLEELQALCQKLMEASAESSD